MDPELSGFALGLLFGAAKIMTIGTVGFGIAWWRARRRVRELEAAQQQPSLLEERLDRLEQGFDYSATQLDRLVEGQSELSRQLGAGQAELPSIRREPRTPVTPATPG